MPTSSIFHNVVIDTPEKAERYICGKKLILIDDVCTTGSTLSVCAELLLDAGAEEVIAAVFAKTVDLSRNKRESKKFSKKRTVDLK